MIGTIFDRLSETLVHLGEKRIVTLQLGDLQISFDQAAMIMSWVVIALLIGVALLLRRALKQSVEDRPNRTHAALDALMDLLEGQLTSSFSSDRLAAALFPFISTLFLYVLLCNWVGIIPGLISPTQNLNITLGLALMVFFLTQVLAIRAKGIKGYVKGFFEPIPILLPLNIVGEIAKVMSHAFRLFGNVLAGTILVTVVTAKFTPVIFPSFLQLVFGLFFGLIQAFVFAILAVAYINVAVES